MLNKDKNLKLLKIENCGSKTWDRDTETEQIKTQVYLQASSGDMQLFAFVDLSEVIKHRICVSARKSDSPGRSLVSFLALLFIEHILSKKFKLHNLIHS